MANPWETQFEQAAGQLYNRQVGHDEWPKEFLTNDTTFMDAWYKTVFKSFEIPGQSPKDPVAGMVLRVETIWEPSPLSERALLGDISQVEVKKVLQMRVHTQFDTFLGFPSNFLTPDSDEMMMIMTHPVYEADIKTEAPSPGDIVRVRHAWGGAQGFRNRVGWYLGPIAEGMPVQIEKTKKSIQSAKKKAASTKCGGRKKDVPNTLGESLRESGARPTFAEDTGAVGGQGA